jgi:hypothetical protein
VLAQLGDVRRQGGKVGVVFEDCEGKTTLRLVGDVGAGPVPLGIDKTLPRLLLPTERTEVGEMVERAVAQIDAMDLGAAGVSAALAAMLRGDLR